MSTLAPSSSVTEYANAVRDRLAGLDADVVDDLTGGLEADLAEAMSERLPETASPDLVDIEAAFGSPARYAEELLAAAGLELPAPPGARRRSLRQSATAAVAAGLDTWQHWRTQHRWFSAVVDFLLVLRPAWWLLRAWVLFQLVLVFASIRTEPGISLLGHGAEPLLLIALVVLSVLWGQRRLGQRPWQRTLGLLLSVVAALYVAPLLSMLQQPEPSASADDYEQGYTDGQWASATGPTDDVDAGVGQASNLFVYDASGQPVQDAQIVDQNGEPVVLADPDGVPWSRWDRRSWNGESIPAAALSGEPMNVYPWAYVPAQDLDTDEDGMLSGDSALAQDPRWPAATLFPVPGSDAADDASEAAGTEPSAEASTSSD